MVFKLLEACCFAFKKVHFFCIFGGLTLLLLSFVLFLTLVVNLIQVVVVKNRYEAANPCLVLAQTTERQPCTSSGCHYLYRPVLSVQFTIQCSSGPNCTNGSEMIVANAYEDPDATWYSNPDEVDLYFKHYPIGTTHVCFYDTSQVTQVVMTNNARFLGPSTAIRFLLMVVFVVVGVPITFWGLRRYMKKQAKAEMKELKKSGKLGKAQAKYGTFQRDKELKKMGKKKMGKVDKVKKLGKLVLETA